MLISGISDRFRMSSDESALISEEIFKDFQLNKEFGFYHCCDGQGNGVLDIEMFSESTNISNEILGDKFYYTRVCWCDVHSEEYLKLI